LAAAPLCPLPVEIQKKSTASDKILLKNAFSSVERLFNVGAGSFQELNHKTALNPIKGFTRRNKKKEPNKNLQIDKITLMYVRPKRN
jgi:hypothetical protein